MLKWLHGGLSAVTGIAEPEYGTDYIHSATDRVREEQEQPFHEVTRDDLCWLVPDHTNVETATFYFSDLNTGIVGFAQVIHSNIVGMHTTGQFTCRVFNTHDPDALSLWTSTKLEDFKAEGPNFYANGLSIELNEASDEYHVKSQVNERSVVDLYFKRLAPGCKVGSDPTTYYGDNLEMPWGTMRHIFWPRNAVRGALNLKVSKSKRDDAEELEDIVLEFKENVYSLFILALQGMKPHHAAKSWNFINLQTKDSSALLIEFTTPKSYGNTRVSIGIVTKDNKILSLTIDNTVNHVDAQVDEIGWKVPKSITVDLEGISPRVTKEQIQAGSIPEEDKFRATISTPLTKMIERIDVMNEIPQFVKNIVSGVAGTKPYIYQYADDEDFSLQIGTATTKTKGLGWCEVTFIAESEQVSEESYNED